MAKKVYAIQYGFDLKNNKKIENKIVETWAECLSYVKGIKGAKYKSFENILDAKNYLNQGSSMLKKIDDNYPKDCLHAYVDGSYSVSDGRYSYGVVCVKNNIIEYIESGAEKDISDRNIRQIAGELKGALRAANYALDKGEKKIVIFHDYEGIANHATGAWSRNEKSSVEYYNKMQELMKNGLEIIFVKVDSHTGDLFNELVDEKCKELLGIQSDKIIEKHLISDKIYVTNSDVKDKIITLAPNSEKNIIIVDASFTEEISNSKCIKLSNITDIELDNELRYLEITELYKNNPDQAKKIISKMLSKDKEKYILYLLKSK